MLPGLEKLRNWAFWSRDLVKSNKIGKHYREIGHLLENPQSKEAKAITKDNLKRVLDHATRSVDYYLSYKNYRDLQDFPITDKSTIIGHFDKMRSSVYYYAENFKVLTSGAISSPSSVLHDAGKRDRHIADTIYFMEQSGADIGNKLVYLGHWSSKHQISKLRTYMHNMMPIKVLEDTESDMSVLVEKLIKDRSDKYIVGHPSHFELLCDHLDEHATDLQECKVQAIISMAEGLQDYQRSSLTKYFRAPVYERYGNTENGIIAQETGDSPDALKLNTASYVIEILEEHTDRHVKPGAVGRIVITDLFNYAMPMIRYDTGDLAQFGLNSEGIPVILKIYGQRMDLIYDSEGNLVSPHIFSQVGEFSKDNHFQFTQKGKKEYSMKLHGLPENTNEVGLTAHFRKHLGQEAVIDFEYTHQIPRSASAKRISVLNAYLKTHGKNNRMFTP